MLQFFYMPMSQEIGLIVPQIGKIVFSMILDLVRDHKLSVVDSDFSVLNQT